MEQIVKLIVLNFDGYEKMTKEQLLYKVRVMLSVLRKELNKEESE
jgi:hypothetical protein